MGIPSAGTGHGKLQPDRKIPQKAAGIREGNLQGYLYETPDSSLGCHEAVCVQVPT